MSKIVLIDDDRQTASVLAATLRVLGHEIRIANSAEEGEVVIAEEKPQIAMIDMMLPGVSGLDLIEQLAAQPGQTYLCLVTGMADYRLLKRAVSLGASSLLSKPFALPDLLSVLQMAERLRNIRFKIESGNCSTTVEALALTNLDFDTLDIAAAACGSFAAAVGADNDVAERITPIAVTELLTNACRHGGGTGDLTCRAEGEQLFMCVSSAGRGFAWQRELARRKTNWESSKASGLQLVSAFSESPRFEDEGRTVHVEISIHSPIPKATSAVSAAVL